MKKTLIIAIFLLFVSFPTLLFSQSGYQGHLKVRGDYGAVQIGYNDYSVLTLGKGGGAQGEPNNGAFGIEYWGNGLNFWKPWPNPYGGNYKFFIADNGNVGIGRSPSYRLDVNGQIRMGSILITSDERLKENFVRLKNTSKILSALVPYQYSYIKTRETVKQDSLSVNVLKLEPPREYDDEIHFGFKAQDLEKVFPNLVSEDEKGIKSINYIEIIPLLVTAIQEQQAQIEGFQKQIEEMQAGIYGADFIIDDGTSQPNKAPRQNNENEVGNETETSNVLYQNSPNPFSQSTTIKYQLSDNATNAKICIYNLTGKQLQCHNLQTIKGESSIEVRASSLQAGMYLYSLIVDDKLIATKRMILTE